MIRDGMQFRPAPHIRYNLGRFWYKKSGLAVPELEVTESGTGYGKITQHERLRSFVVDGEELFVARYWTTPLYLVYDGQVWQTTLHHYRPPIRFLMNRHGMEYPSAVAAVKEYKVFT